MTLRAAAAIRAGLLVLLLVAAALGATVAGASSLGLSGPAFGLPGVFICPVPPVDGSAADCG